MLRHYDRHLYQALVVVHFGCLLWCRKAAQIDTVAIESDPPAAAPVVAEPSGVTSLYDLLRAKIDWQVDEVDPNKMTTTDEAEDLRGKIAEAEGGPPVT